VQPRHEARLQPFRGNGARGGETGHITWLDAATAAYSHSGCGAGYQRRWGDRFPGGTGGSTHAGPSLSIHLM
jgi:hypothetical protein